MKDEAKPANPPGINTRIASRVRAMRAELGLTLDALAGKSKVSRSMLSLVERGETSPTAVVLEKIATALGVPLALLFESPTSPASPVSRRKERTPWRDPQSGYVRCNLSPANFPSPIRIVRVELPAGAKVAYETNAPDIGIHQQVWVQKGVVELTSGDTTHRLADDDCFAMRLNAPTTFHNPTRQPTRYLVVVAMMERSRAGRK